MARIRELNGTDQDLKNDMSRSFQSGHINFLIGAGASHPAIPPAGPVEQEINALRLADEHEQADRRLCELISTVQGPSNRLLQKTANAQDQATLKSYEAFLRNIETIVTERRTNVLPKQATVFTTNYDIFLDTAARSCAELRLGTGFGSLPAADDVWEYSSGTFFLTTYDTGNLYDYRVELAALALVKLHGISRCESWQAAD